MRTAVHNTDPLPISHYWGLVKGLDDSRKLELATMLIDSVKPMLTASMHDTTTEEDFPVIKEEHLRPYTMEEINAMIDESERQIAAGQYKPIEEVFRRWDMEDSDMVAEEETEYGAV